MTMLKSLQNSGAAWRLRRLWWRYSDWLLAPWRVARHYNRDLSELTLWLLRVEDDVIDLSMESVAWRELRDLEVRVEMLEEEAAAQEATEYRKLDESFEHANGEVLSQIEIEEARR
jgi:DNA-binding GntR family transcriptional regulator